MTGAEYIANYLVNQGVTDVFGIPGGVVVDLLYAIDAKDGITPHLSCHEQAAALAAMGYAQAGGKLGVAYASRGPGFTNLITGIADCYFENVPALFITAHDFPFEQTSERFAHEQEFDTVAHVAPITKFAARVENISELAPLLEKAVSTALSKEQCPVFLDFLTKVFLEVVEC